MAEFNINREIVRLISDNWKNHIKGVWKLLILLYGCTAMIILSNIHLLKQIQQTLGTQFGNYNS